MVGVVCLGSFNPIAYGHRDIIERALRLFDKVIVAGARDRRLGRRHLGFHPSRRGGALRQRLGMVPVRAACLLLSLSLVAGARAEQPAVAEESVHAGDMQIELYAAPKRLTFVQPYFPMVAREPGRDGWVQLQLMVDPQGKPYEIVVVDAIGHKSLRTAAIRSLQQSSFEPARLGSTPVHGAYQMKIVFSLTGRLDVSRRAQRNYDRLRRLVREGDREGADDVMADINRSTAQHNLYEDAWLHMAKYMYFQRWGTSRAQLAALNRAVAHEVGSTILPEQVFRAAQRMRFSLLVELNDFAAALAAFESLQEIGLEEAEHERFQPMVDEILALQADDRAYSVSGETDKHGHWAVGLLKDDFSLHDIQGRIATIKLYCDTKFVFFRFEPELEYHVADNVGDCRLTALGDAGTTFTLVQH